jgi:hypothetical protein
LTPILFIVGGGLFNLYSECLTKEGFGDLKIEQIIKTVKHANDLVLLAKKGMVLQDMVDKLIEIGRSHGMEINVGKTKVIGISRQPFQAKLMIHQKNRRMWNLFNTSVAC